MHDEETEETEALSLKQRALIAALEHFKGLEIDEKSDRALVAKSVIEAFKSARAVLDEDESEDDSEDKPDTAQVVAAAFWYHTTDCYNDIDIAEIDPDCGGAEHFLGFANALLVLLAAEQASYFAVALPDPSLEEADAALRIINAKHR